MDNGQFPASNFLFQTSLDGLPGYCTTGGAEPLFGRAWNPAPRLEPILVLLRISIEFCLVFVFAFALFVPGRLLAQPFGQGFKIRRI